MRVRRRIGRRGGEGGLMGRWEGVLAAPGDTGSGLHGLAKRLKESTCVSRLQTREWEDGDSLHVH
jgi:hypothetical protein